MMETNLGNRLISAEEKLDKSELLFYNIDYKRSASNTFTPIPELSIYMEKQTGIYLQHVF
jgi:hypothetical protein